MGSQLRIIAMGRIIHCSDLILRLPDNQEVANLTEWLYDSTEYRPIKPETCDIREELDNQQKILVIVMIWTFLVFLSIFYCYFCEQKLFPTQMLFSTCLVDRAGFLQDGRCPNGNCNITKSKRQLPHFSPSLDLTRYRSSHLQSHRELLRSPMNNQTGSSEELLLGEFRLLSNSQTQDSLDHSDKDYLLKERNL